MKIILKFLKPVLYFKCKNLRYRTGFNVYIIMLINTKKIKKELEEFINEIVNIENKLNFLNY